MSNVVVRSQRVYVLDHGQQYGPHTPEEVAAMVQAGTLSPAAQVCTPGGAGWQPLPVHVAAMAPALPTVQSIPVSTTADLALAVAAAANATAVEALHAARGGNTSRRKPAAKSRTPFMAGFGVTMGVLAALLVVGLLIRGKEAASNVGRPGVTMAQYNQIRQGMDYAQVRAIMGTEGELVDSTSAEWGGPVNVSADVRTYRWRDSDGGALGVVFDKGRVEIKVQKGLR